MQLNIRTKLIGQVGDTAAHMSEASTQFANVSQQPGQATTGISTFNQQVVNGTNEQSQGVQQVTTTIILSPNCTPIGYSRGDFKLLIACLCA